MLKVDKIERHVKKFFYGICRTLSDFSKMTLINVIALVVFKILLSHFSQANVTDDLIKISKSAQPDIAVNFNILSETLTVLYKSI